MRTAFCRTVHALMATDDRVHVLTGDIGYGNFDDIARDFPDRFHNAGVAEANMMSTAAGLALCGKIPFVFSIATFVTMRCFEQIRVDVCYHRLPVKIVSTGGGIIYGHQGTTHHAIEEMGILRAVPNMTVICPADPRDVANALRATMDLAGPAYIRTSRNKEPVFPGTDQPFRLGKGTLLRDGRDVAILACGRLVGNALAAADLLLKAGLSARVVNMHTLKPIDRETVLRCAEEAGAVVTVEEHNVIGGLGSAVAEVLAEASSGVPFRRVGIPDVYCDTHAEYHELDVKFGLDADGIARSVRTLLEEGRTVPAVAGGRAR